MKIGNEKFNLNISIQNNVLSKNENFSTNKKNVSTDLFDLSAKGFAYIQKQKEHQESKPKGDPNILAMRIAMRIMNGDKVPKEDEKFLMELNPKLYMEAKMIGETKESDKEHESLLEDDEGSDENEKQESSDGVVINDTGNSAESFTE